MTATSGFITAVSASTASASATAPITVTVPSEAQAGDVLIWVATGTGGGATNFEVSYTGTDPWNQITGGPAIWKALTSADLGQSFTVQVDNSGAAGTAYSTMIVYRSPIGPGQVYDGAYAVSGLTSNAAFNTTEPNDKMVYVWFGADAAGSSGPTVPAGLAMQYEQDRCAVGDTTLATPGAAPQETDSSAGCANEYTLAFAIKMALPPNAPTLTSPSNAQYIDPANGATLEGVYNSTDGSAQIAYACRLKPSGATSYSYWNASTGALQSTIVWNSDTIFPGDTFTVSIPASALTNNTSYNWSLASENQSGNLEGNFASDFTFTTQTAPSVSVTAPTGTYTLSSYPIVTWADTLPSRISQTAYRVVVEFGSYGTVPGSGTVAWDSGVVPKSDLQTQVANSLAANVTFRAFVQVTETGGETSQWAYTTFTTGFDAPAAPGLTASAGADPSTGAPVITLQVQGHDNLLSAADASFEGSLGAWTSGSNTSIAASSAAAQDGSESMAMTAAAAGNMSATSNIYSL